MGIDSIALRFVFSFVVAYLAFVLNVGMWLISMPRVDHRMLMSGDSSEMGTGCPADESEKLTAAIEACMRSAAQNQQHGFLSFIFAVVALGFIFLLT